jgi:hypothetical protein
MGGLRKPIQRRQKGTDHEEKAKAVERVDTEDFDQKTTFLCTYRRLGAPALAPLRRGGGVWACDWKPKATDGVHSVPFFRWIWNGFSVLLLVYLVCFSRFSMTQPTSSDKYLLKGRFPFLLSLFLFRMSFSWFVYLLLIAWKSSLSATLELGSPNCLFVSCETSSNPRQRY